MIPACSLILAKSRPLRILVMDDEPERVDAYKQAFSGDAHLIHAPSSGAAQYQLKSTHYDVVFLDHDLELSETHWGITDHGSGTELVEYLCRMGPHRWEHTLFIVHSLNNRRGASMFENLFCRGFNVTRRAYAWMDAADLRGLVRDWDWPENLHRWDCTYPPHKPVLKKHSMNERRQQGNT